MTVTDEHDHDIVIVSPNGALDSYYVLAELATEAVNRATRVFHTAGGKGHNMARAAVRLGGRVLSIGIAGGDAGRFVARELAREGIGHDLVWSESETRRCNTLYYASGRDTTVVLEPGPAVGEVAQQALSERVAARAAEAPYLALTGSLPPDFPPDYYAGLVQAGRAAGVKVCVDSTHEPLRLAAQAGPYLIKVNQREFCLAFGGPDCVLSRQFAERVYTQLHANGVEVVIVTDGSRGAFVLAPACAPFRVQTPVESWQSTAGAGDTFMAALLLALGRGEPLAAATCYASAAAAANLQQLGCGFLTVEDVARFRQVTTLTAWAEGA